MRMCSPMLCIITNISHQQSACGDDNAQPCAMRNLLLYVCMTTEMLHTRHGSSQLCCQQVYKYLARTTTKVLSH